MAPARSLRLAPEWDRRFGRMVAVSAVVHVVALVAIIVFADRLASRPLPMMAYTVELTDPSALGGRLPPGAPGADLRGGSQAPPAPAAPEPAPAPAEVAKAEPAPAAPPAPEPAPEPAKAEPAAEPPKPPEPAAEAKVIPEPKLEPKAEPKPEPKAEPKPEPKAEPKPIPKAEAKQPPKPEAKKPEPARPAAKPAETAKADAKKPPAATAPAPSAAAAASGGEATAPKDAYAAAAERWRSKGRGGLGGTDDASGPLGAGGSGPGGGGQLVGLDFLAYRQQVINTIKARWTNVFGRPGLVAAVYFEIAPDGAVSGIRLQQGSGNAAYDASAVRAVQHAGQLAPPPARYQREFREFVIEFHSEEPGGQGSG